MMVKITLCLTLIGIIGLANCLLHERLEIAGRNDAAVVNLSGRQRVLTEQIVNLSHRLIHAENQQIRATIRVGLKESIGRMAQEHDHLTKPESNPKFAIGLSQKLRSLYFEQPHDLDSNVRQYLRAASELAKTADNALNTENPHARYVESHYKKLATSLESVVAQHQDESKRRLEKLRQLSWGGFVISGTILVVIGFFVFRPMVHRIEKNREAMEEANTNLEKRVKERTKLYKEQKQLLQSILDNLGEGIVVCDRDGKFIQFNPAAERLLGIGAGDVPPEKWSEHYGVFLIDQVTPCPMEQLPLVRAFSGKHVASDELFVRNEKVPQGIWINCIAVPLLD